MAQATPPDPGFEPDGWSNRARIGLLVPDRDVGPESEWSAMLPAGVSMHASRFAFPVGEVAEGEKRLIGRDPVEFVARPGPLDAAVALLADAPVDAIALAFTSTSYIGGAGHDARLAARLGRSANGRPVLTTGEAIVAALRYLDPATVMLVDPPWFPAGLTGSGRAWLEGEGFAVSLAISAALPSGQGNIRPDALYRWVKENLADGTGAIVIGGNGFRAVGTVGRLERDLGVPVVTANTALLWHTLRTLGLPTDEVTRYGGLFGPRSGIAG